MNGGFERYEREYLARRGVDELTPEERRWVARVEAARKAATEAALDPWDYVVLEMARRGNPRISMKVGTMRAAESFLKLFCHGMIAKLDRPPTFDELERLQAFLDSAEYRQYKDRLRKLMTEEVKGRLKVVSEITGVRGPEDMWDLTDKGRGAPRTKRAEIIALHDRMDKQYRADRTAFYKDVESYVWALPMMAVMGIGAGAMMAYVHSVAGASHVMLDSVGHLECADIGHGVDFSGLFGF